MREISTRVAVKPMDERWCVVLTDEDGYTLELLDTCRTEADALAASHERRQPASHGG